MFREASRTGISGTLLIVSTTFYQALKGFWALQYSAGRLATRELYILLCLQLATRITWSAGSVGSMSEKPGRYTAVM